MRNNIVLVCDDERIARDLLPKLLFLRNNDVVSFVTYAQALSGTDFSLFDSVVIYETSSKERTIDLIKSLRKYSNLHLLLLAKDYDTDFILQAYEKGIDDFALTDANSAELVLRMVKGLKFNALKAAFLRSQKLLEQLKVVDERYGIYSYSSARLVIENRIDYELLKTGHFIAITQDAMSNGGLDELCSAIKSSIRSEDVVTVGKSKSFYVFLPYTEINGAISVVAKIQENLGEDYKIHAGITGFANSFQQMEKEALQILFEAVSTDAQYKISEKSEIKVDDWLESELEVKNYKIFKQIFNKKLENVVTPVFYRMQKNWEEKLFSTNIEQYVNEQECIFELIHKKQKSSLKLVYQGFTKIVVQIIHEGLDSPENDEFSISLTKINQTLLIDIMEKFIKDFKEYVECGE